MTPEQDFNETAHTLLKKLRAIPTSQLTGLEQEWRDNAAENWTHNPGFGAYYQDAVADLITILREYRT